MRSPWKIPCATPAWGAWSLWTMSHPSQVGSVIGRNISKVGDISWKLSSQNLFRHEQYRVSGLTLGDDFVVVEADRSACRSQEQTCRGAPNQNKNHQLRVHRKHQNIKQKIALGESQSGDVRRGLLSVPQNAPFRDHENYLTGNVLPT